MERIIQIARQVTESNSALPFSVYTSCNEQHIVNVPIIKPVLIMVLDGCKHLGRDSEALCEQGRFVFLSNTNSIEMRNIPSDRGYFALLIEFEYDDFGVLKRNNRIAKPYFLGDIDSGLKLSLQQFIEWSAIAPASLWSHRRQELLQLLVYLGHEDLTSIMKPLNVTQALYELIGADSSFEVKEESTADRLAAKLAMSESTLRRKLKAEGSSIQTIRDTIRLGRGLHLVQSTFQPIGLIAEQCGYQSQSRFTDKFKQLFGMTPTDLRKTRMSE